MRLAQDEGVQDDAIGADITPTYDRSCPFGVKTPECPFGSVHNVKKREMSDRAARQVLYLLNETSANEMAVVVDGPRATGASAPAAASRRTAACRTTPPSRPSRRQVPAAGLRF